MLGEGSDTTQWNHANAVLEVSDVPRAIAYYGDVLGLFLGWMWEGRVGAYNRTQPDRDLLSSIRSPVPVETCCLRR